MPAEWAPQQAVWLSWPTNRKLWPERFEAIEAQFAELTALLARYQPVHINCAKGSQPDAQRLIREAGAQADRVRLFDIPTNDAWCRDHGPTFVKHRETGALACVDWQFNAWGGKYPPWDLDNAVPARIAEQLGLERAEVPMICEGGAIETNGAGVLLTTESVLLNPNRNPDIARDTIETHLRKNLGVDTVFWLKSGLAGDDTDGHIDTLTRFFAENGVVTCVERNTRDANHRPLAENTERLQGLRTADNSRMDIAELPLPEPIITEGWREPRLPGSYANFLIINGAVIVPTYRQPKPDDHACGLLRELFGPTGREIVPFDCLDIVMEGGAVHCLTQQMPA